MSPTDLKISSKKRIFFDRCTAATSSGIAKGAKKEGLQISAESAQKTAVLDSSFLSVSWICTALSFMEYEGEAHSDTSLR